MSKRNSLQAVLEQARGGGAPVPPKAEPASPKVPRRPAARAAEPAATPEEAAPTPRRPSREGRRLVAGHFEPHVAKQLKLMSVEEDTTVQALLEEALDLLFVKKGRGPIVRG